MILQKKYEIAVVMINYNSSYHTKKCIESIIEKTAKNISFQIIVVDNCSEIEDYQLLKSYCNMQDFKDLQLVRNKINTGFGSGNMLGVNYSNCDYYAFINNDSVFLNDCLSILLKAFKTNNNFSICGPQAYKENGDMLTVIDHFASPIKEIFGRKILEKINPKQYPNRKKIYNEPQKAQFISGSFIFVKASDFNEVGGFDTNIFLYHEETDLCKRLQKINKFVHLIPDAKYIHYHGVSTPNSIDIKIELKISFLYIIRKHYGWFWHKLILVYLQIQYFIKSIFKPKYWKLFGVLYVGAPLSKSLKLRQKIKS